MRRCIIFNESFLRKITLVSEQVIMSKIQSVIYQDYVNFKQKKVDLAEEPNFGKSPVNEVLVEEVTDSFKRAMMTKPVTFFDFLALKEGEIQSQLINSVFTATLAPTMIAFNPFCDKPKKDKEYLAFRQFVSVVIALAGTLPLTLLVNKQIARIGSEGDIASIDIRMAPHKDYLRPEFKKAFKAASVSSDKKQAFEAEIGLKDKRIMALRDSNNPIEKLYYKANLEQCYVDKERTKASSFFAQLIGKNVFDQNGNVKTLLEKNTGDILILDKNNKPAIRFSKKDSGKIQILDESGKVVILDKSGKVRKSLKETADCYELKRDIPKITSIEELKAYISKYSIYKRSFGEFMSENFGFEFYSNGKSIKPDSTLKKLSDVNIKNFLESIGLNKKVEANTIRKVIGTAYQGKLVKELHNVFNEEKGGREFDTLADVISKMIHRAIQNETGEKNSKIINASLNQFIDRTGFLDQFTPKNINAKRFEEEELKLLQLQELMNSPIAKVMGALKSTFEKNGLSEMFKEEKGVEGITERYVKKLTSGLTENFKNTSKLYSLLVAMIITMGTCAVLNWSYPRIIEKFFPQLLVKDKPSDSKKGGSK